MPATAILGLLVLAAPRGAADGSFATLAELSRSFDEAAAKADAAATAATRFGALRAVAERRLAALEAYLAEKPSSPDREAALAAAAESAVEVEHWAAAKSASRAYLGAYPGGARRGAVRLAGALADSILEPDAGAAVRDEFERAAAEADGDFAVAFGAWDALVDWQLDRGDAGRASDALEKLRVALRSQPGIEPFVERRRLELAKAGAAPLPIDAKDLDGRPVRLADLRGKVVLIDFWATWCPPCRAEAPRVVAAYRRHRDRGLEVVGVSLDREGEERALRDFCAEYGMAWPQLFDGKGWNSEIAVRYGVTGIPATYLLDRDGKIRRFGLRGEALSRSVERLLRSGPSSSPAPEPGR